MPIDIANPLYYIGVVDWRSLLIAAAFTAPWLVAISWGKLRSGWIWLALILGIVVFPVSIAWVQVPLQTILNQLIVGALGLETTQAWTWLAAIPVVGMSGVVQEAVKFIIALAVVRWGLKDRRPWVAMATGAAVGAGYGGYEALWVFNLVFGSGWSWATVDLAGPAALIPFVERFWTVPFHIGTVSIAMYLYRRGHPVLGYILAALLHAAINYGVVLLGLGILNQMTVEVWVGVFGLVTIAVAIWLRWTKARTLPEPPEPMKSEPQASG